MGGGTGGGAGGSGGSSGGTGAAGGVAGAGGVGGLVGTGGDASTDPVADVGTDADAGTDADVSQPWMPTSFPNCLLWLDAADPSTLSVSGAFVDAWNSKCGSSASATSSANKRPQLTIVDGKPALSCDGTDDELALSAAFVDAKEYTVLVALSQSPATNQQVIWSNRNVPPAVGGTVTYTGFAATGHLFAYQDSALPAAVLVGASTLPKARWVIAFTVTSAGVRTLSVNGVTYATGSSAGVATRLPAGLLCADLANAEHAQHALFEVVMYDRALTTSELSAANTALVQKWVL